MVTRSAHVAMALVLAVAMVGCAKRPATTQATAPAPSGAAGMSSGSSGTGAATAAPSGAGAGGSSNLAAPGGAGAGGGSTAGGGPVAAGAARPSPRDFVAVSDLADVYFDFDKYDIRPNDARTLDSNAQWLKRNPDHLLLIEGHCDERGTNEYNLALGERRAKSAMNYLVSQGVQASRITIISYGEERPVCTEKNESCWSRNRRAHFLVKPR
jgi:peptidoglycan-associated lipoprotein